MKVKDWLSVVEGNFKVKIGEEPASIDLFSKKDIIDVYGDAELQEVIIDYEKRCTTLKMAIHSQCASYRTKIFQRHLTDYEQGVYFGVYGEHKECVEEVYGYCTATRELDRCFCHGDRNKCSLHRGDL